MNQLNQQKPPLAVYFVWHPTDTKKAEVFTEKFRSYLTRDIDKPFSRELNIPTFFYSSKDANKAPPEQPQPLAEKNILYAILSIETLTNSDWKNYIEAISKDFIIIPVAIDSHGLTHTTDPRLKNMQAIRAFNWNPKLYEQYAILELSHELYRWGFDNPKEEVHGYDSSLKLFLSHAKPGNTGRLHAESIRDFIDRSNLRRFFDTYQISTGFEFNKELDENVKDSTIIAIISDAYSSRYWCQREVLTAKQSQRPLIVVNSLEKYEDRLFPPLSNVPGVHVTAEPLTDENILQILIAALIETIRFNYASNLLNYYKNLGWIDKDSVILSRPPDIHQVVEILTERNQSRDDTSKLHICYPEPPLYAEETTWTNFFNITVSTPLWSSKDSHQQHKEVGISISDFEHDCYEHDHTHLDELKRFAQNLTRHLLAREHSLIYGGDLRNDGFTKTILEEAKILQDKLDTQNTFVTNYLAWPIHLQEEKKEFKAKYYRIVEQQEVKLPNDVKHFVQNEKVYLPPNSVSNRYIWSRSLTEMRIQSINKSDVRVFAGGKTCGYLGKMPGVLEEFLIAYGQSKPIYLVGGLGGISKVISDIILNKSKKCEVLTEDWQITHTHDYQYLNEKAKEYGNQADYDKIFELLRKIDLITLAKVSGLSETKYIKLMETTFVDECVHLILEGMNNLR